MSSGMSTREIGKEINVSHERVRQIYKVYLKTREIPKLNTVGRPRKQLTETEVNLIITSFAKYKVSASWLRKIIKHRSGISINHNKIHEILLENNMAKKTEKKIRKKLWVRYERDHSLTAVH